MKAVREVNGYRLIYKPDHPSCMKSKNWNGYVYEHILVAESNLGRRLQDNECVHHMDGNKQNNHNSNILVLLCSEHARLHWWLDKGAPYEKSHGVNRKNSGNSQLYCKVCSLSLQRDQNGFCSVECSRKFHRKVMTRPSLEVILNDTSTIGWKATGRKYGVSDNCVRKWLRGYKKTILSLASGIPLEGAETTGEVKSS